jgi:hypothetical protein
MHLEELKHVLPGLQHQGDKIARALQRARDRDDVDAVRRLSGEFGTVVGLRQRIELALRSLGATTSALPIRAGKAKRR